ncbi:hypothetical protein JCM11491_004296 [Sporobolomyces phaffii]
MSFVAKADVPALKSHLDHYGLRYSVSPHFPSLEFPLLVHPRSYRPYSMAESFSGGDGIDDASLLAAHATEPAVTPPRAVENMAAPSSSSHPSRPTSPRLAPPTAYYTTYTSPQPIATPQPPPRAPSTEHSYPSQTPELEYEQPPRASSSNYNKTIKVVQWTPQRGEEGTQVTIILDSSVIQFAQPSLHNPASLPNFGASTSIGSNPSEVNRSFSVLFGQAPAPTDFTRAQAIDGNGVGQSMNAGPNEDEAFVVLTTFAPPRHAMGPAGEPILVVVRVLDEAGAIVESSIIGNWDVGVIPPNPARVSGLKRSGETLVSDRDAPGISSPGQSQPGSPNRAGIEWTAASAPPQIAIPAIHTSTVDDTPSDSIAAPIPPPNLGGQPELVRTSQISGPKSGSGASYSHKVVLKLQGDLNTMAMGWSNEEWQNRRRLIQFWPQQDGNIVNVAFRPVAQNDWQPNSITVSCIFRDDWNECFVTSVDTIYLLEALVGSRFSVEEKNRIRRNLEGFKPLTVSKSKPDAEPFFKLIMGFPQPKPRNIEKDVKAFPWKILSNALKKIMSKYSANYPLSNDPSAGPTSSATFTRTDSGSRLGAPSSPRPSNSPASPTAHAVQSPHLVQSPNLGNASTSGHFSHTSTPLLNQSPRLSSSAFVPRSPQVHSLPHSPVVPPSPQRHNLVPPPVSTYASRPSYELPGAYDARDYPVAQPGMYGVGPSNSNGGHHQHQLFPSAEDYGVNNHQHHHHLAPIHPNASMNHYRSYSEGLPRTTQDGQPAIYSSAPPSINQPFQPYDAAPHAPQHFYSQPPSSWIPPSHVPGPPSGIGGPGGGGLDRVEGSQQ